MSEENDDQELEEVRQFFEQTITYAELQCKIGVRRQIKSTKFKAFDFLFDLQFSENKGTSQPLLGILPLFYSILNVLVESLRSYFPLEEGRRMAIFTIHANPLIPQPFRYYLHSKEDIISQVMARFFHIL